MQLSINKRFRIPDKITLLPKSSIVLENGMFVTLAHFNGGEYYTIITIHQDCLSCMVLEHLGKTINKYHDTALIAISDTRFALIDNGDTLYIYGSINEPPEILKIEQAEVLETFSRHGQIPRVYGLSSAGKHENQHAVIFSEAICSQESRYLACLYISEPEKTASWEKIYALPNKDYPMDRFGGLMIEADDEDAVNGSPIVGHIMFLNNQLYVFVEGSDYGSVNRYGMDFCTLAEINPDGTIKKRIFEISGWKRESKKHGIRGTFTSSGQYLIMTPVFASDEWKGKQKLFSLSQNELLDIRLPRGTNKCSIIEHYANNFWLTDFTTEIMLCDE